MQTGFHLKDFFTIIGADQTNQGHATKVGDQIITIEENPTFEGVDQMKKKWKTRKPNIIKLR